MLTQPCNAALPYLPCHPPVIVWGSNGAVLSCPLQHSVPQSLLPLQYFKPGFGASPPTGWGAAGAGARSELPLPWSTPVLSQLVMKKGNIAIKIGAGIWAWTQERCTEKGWKVLWQVNPTGEGKRIAPCFSLFFSSKDAVVRNEQSFLFSVLLVVLLIWLFF